MTSDQIAFVSGEFAIYKALRGGIRDGKVYHLTDPAARGQIDAIESLFPTGRQAIAIVTRDGGSSDEYILKMRGLNGALNYDVSFQNDSRKLVMTGSQINGQGIVVQLPDAQTSEIVYLRGQ